MLDKIESASFEFWKSSPLGVASNCIFGDIDHVVRVNNILVLRGWLVEFDITSLSLSIGCFDRWAYPLFSNEPRIDVVKDFPSLSQTSILGVGYILENSMCTGSYVDLFWKLLFLDNSEKTVPAGRKQIIEASV